MVDAQKPKITAVIVLYKRQADQSEAFLSLREMLSQTSALRAGREIDLLLYDNSPSAPAQGPGGGLGYHHDPANGGLAAAYNYALNHARTVGSEWLLLLDQDTTLTQIYLDSLFDAIRLTAADPSIAAFVPLLEMHGRIYSPEATFFYHLRHQFPHPRDFPVQREVSGVQPARLNAYNSGAAVRVSALESIGGFPAAFHVDYLDHAIFHLLQQQRMKVYVLPAILRQQLSHIDLDAVPLTRHQSVLDSQTRFVARYGAFVDALLFRLWLLRKSRLYRRLCSDPRVWRGMVRRALLPWPASLKGRQR
jgi:glycosyltransferase involved in cell wall biosynthesis